MNTTLRLALVLVGGLLMAGPVGFFLIPGQAGIWLNELQASKAFNPFADFRQLYLLVCLLAGLLMVLAAVRSGGAQVDAAERAAVGRKGRALALVAGCAAGVALGTLAWWTIPAPYTAISELHIQSKRERILFETTEDQTDFEIYKKTQMRYVTSPFVLNAALRNPEVSGLATLRQPQRPLAWLENNIRVTSPGTEFIRVSLSGERPKELTAIVNEITTAYLEVVVNADTLKRRKRLETLTKIRRDREEQLLTKRNRLKTLSENIQAANTTQSNAKQQYLYELHIQMRQELSKIHFELIKARLQLAAMTRDIENVDETTDDGKRVQITGKLGEPIVVKVTETIDGEAQTTEYTADDPDELRDKHPVAAGYYEEFVVNRQADIPESHVDAHLSQEPEIVEQHKKIRKLESVLREIEGQVADDSARLRETQKELEQMRQALEKLQKEIRPRVIQQIESQLAAQARAGESDLKRQIAMLESEHAILEKELEQVTRNQQKTGTLSFDLESLIKDVAKSEGILDAIVDEIQQLTVELESPQRVSLHRLAELPHKRDLRARFAATGIAGLFGFMLAFAAVSRRRRILPPSS